MACAFLFALVLPASAVKTPDVISRATIARLYYDDGSVADLFKDHGNRVNELFDYNFADTNAVYVSDRDEKSCVFLDFPDLPEINHAEHKGVYVSEIVVGHVSNCTRAFSLYWSDTVTNKTTTTLTWHPVEGAQNVVVPGVTNFPVKSRALYVKYVFETTGSDSLCELQVKGWISDMPHKISKSSLGKMYTPEGDLNGENGQSGFSGGQGMGNLFNGKFSDDVHFGRTSSGGYLVIDFSPDRLNGEGWYVTDVIVGEPNELTFSLYYSKDFNTEPKNATWIPVEDAINVNQSGKSTFHINDDVMMVKYVFVETPGWGVGLSEIEVQGMDPEDVACTHPSFTQWTFVEGSATCIVPGLEERFCTICRERSTRQQIEPLGHDYLSHLERAGMYKQFGSGFIDCSRCDWRLDFPFDQETPTNTLPVDFVTTKVQGAPICAVKMTGIVRFVDLIVSSTGNGSEEPNANWGQEPRDLIDGIWNWSWGGYWYSRSKEHDPQPYADFVFGTTIDLAWIDISLDNANSVSRFYSVDDANGQETQLVDFFVIRTDKDHEYPLEAPDPEDIYSDRELNDLVVMKDERISPYAYDENGQTIIGNDGKPVGNNSNYQRFSIRFFEQPIRHLRIRQFSEDGTTARTPTYISEIHPWGTVRGAGDLRYRKETIMIFK